MRRLLVISTAAVAVAMGVPGAASAGRGWAIQPVPMPSNAKHGSLAAVSCWSASGCITVGKFCYHNHCFRQRAMAEEWNGSAWSVQALKRPGVTWASALTGVSCVSARSCMAVGDVNNTPGDAIPYDPTAERWNGSVWAVQPLTIPARASTASMNGVSCTAADQCTAVGSWRAAAHKTMPLAERWNGHAWAMQPTPAQTGVSVSEFNAVSCPTATSCLAVGTIPAAGSITGTPLAQSWDGSAWTIRPIPGPPGSAGTEMTGLSCTAPASCIATGLYFTSTNTVKALAEHWNGSTWTIEPVPGTPATENTELSAVSCVSAASCTAVGFYSRPGAGFTAGLGALAEYWNGSVFRQVQTTHPASHNLLSGVSCLFARSCTAVGWTRQSGVDAGEKTTPLAEQE